MRKDIYIDARCLQDEAYRFRGVGQHVASLLRNARDALEPDYDPCLIGIVDRRLPDLPPEHRGLFDRIQTNAYAHDIDDSWFVQPSPMTHPTEPMARQLYRRNACRAAIVYDFIPLDFPERYLASQQSHHAYQQALSWLSTYDVFLAISRSSGDRLSKVLAIDPSRVVNTGVAVRDSLINSAETTARKRRHILVVGGPDPRKNVESPVIAHARSAELNRRRIQVLIGGNYPEDWCERLRALHLQEGGQPDLLTFLPHIKSEQLAKCYAEAIVTVCPSRTEGFSLPIIEANANGSPVLVADCPAQVELIPDPRDQFPPDDFDRLRGLMETLVVNPAARKAVIERQAGLWRRFTELDVSRRFWRALVEASPVRTPCPAVKRGRKPRIAIATPLPPDPSGVADYSAACIQALTKRGEVHVFTETRDSAPIADVATIETLSTLPYQSGRYDAVVSVLGNSHFHTSIFDLMLDYGGACVAHDARMINFYAVLKGEAEARRVASREMGREVHPGELNVWLHHQRKLPTLFLSEIAEAASPLFVHSHKSQKIIQDLYGAQSTLLPFAIYRPLADNLRSAEGRRRARLVLDLDPCEPLIVTFGGVSPDKAPEDCIWTLQVLKSWGVRARLAFVGEALPPMARHLTHLARELGVQDQVIIYRETVPERLYQLFLAAADAAVQLRTYQLGGLSGGLLDCIAAGLPTVANAHLREAMESPDFVRSVPDGISPVLIAESLMTILSDSGARARAEDASRAYYETHNFDVYAERLMSGLGFG